MIKDLKLEDIKQYLKEKHNITTKARVTKLYNKGEFLQLGDLLIQLDLCNNFNELNENLEIYQELAKTHKKFNKALTKTQNMINAYKQYNINNIPVKAIYKEKNKPYVDFGGNIQSPILFSIDWVLYPQLKESI